MFLLALDLAPGRTFIRMDLAFKNINRNIDTVGQKTGEPCVLPQLVLGGGNSPSGPTFW